MKNERIEILRKVANGELTPEQAIDDVVMSLKGKNLSCWCRLDERCHADLLLELANR